MTKAPWCMREKEVRFQVSSARSKATEPGSDGHGREADTADSDRITLPEFLRQLTRGDGQAAGATFFPNRGDLAHFLDNASEHGMPPLPW